MITKRKILLAGLTMLMILNYIELLKSLFLSKELFAFGKIDAIQYWSAFRILLDGYDPYSDIQMLSLQSQIRDTIQPIMMWNPPWLLTTFVPLLQVESFQSFCQFWFITSILAYLLSSFILIQNFVSQSHGKIILWLLVLSFPPLNSGLILGQVSNWILLGISLLLTGIKKRLPFLTGTGILLVSLKPHLIIAVSPLVLFSILRSGYSFSAMLKIMLIPLAALLPITWLYPLSLKSWILSISGSNLPSLTHSTREWATTTIPSFLMNLSGLSLGYGFLTLLLIVVIYSASLITPSLKNMQFSDKFMLILIIYLPLSCFSWFFDYVIITPALILLWDRLYRDAKIILYLLMFQITGIIFSSFVMSNLQQGLLFIVPVCIFLAYHLIKITNKKFA